MTEIALTHSAVRRLAAKLKHIDTSSLKHTEILDVVADAFGWRTDAFMHALKDTSPKAPSRLFDSPGEPPFGPRTPSLDSLGITDLETWQGIVTNRSGVCILAGPTGSGKSTIQASTARYLHSMGRTIVTEDRIPENPKGVVVSFGEIRCRKSVRDAFDLARHGMLVLATLHASSPAQVVTRVREIGIRDQDLVHLNGAMGVRLAWAACKCRSPDGGRSAEGCDECGHRGVRGRVLVSEVAAFNGPAQIMHHLSSELALRREPFHRDVMVKLKAGLLSACDIEEAFGHRMVAELS